VNQALLAETKRSTPAWPRATAFHSRAPRATAFQHFRRGCIQRSIWWVLPTDEGRLRPNPPQDVARWGIVDELPIKRIASTFWRT
jgi:hypothetical protein